jgi:organic radical activating enzyme
MKILRIFPRKTNATPTDENIVINRMPNLFDEADQINISVAFTWDIPRAEKLYQAWGSVATTHIGGPAFNEAGGEFEPGMYLKEGYTITSRGCPNNCWFCAVPKREPKLRELKIKPGWNVIDDNLLACSYDHIQKVFKMLYKQKQPISLTGGIEARLLRPWHIDLLSSIRLKELFCAYDTPDDYEPLVEAGKLLKQANITYENRKARCYVLVGYPKDTITDALKRIKQTLDAGFFPFAMLWRNEKGEYQKEWKQFQRQCENPIITAVNSKKLINQ